MSIQLDTPAHPCHRLFAAHATMTSTLTAFFPTLTEPASNTTETRILDAPPNNLMIQPWLSGSAGTGTLRVTGWCFNPGTNLWVSHLIGSWAITCGTTSTTWLGTAMFPALLYAKTQGDGLSHEASATEKVPGFLHVDTKGFLKVGVSLNSASATGNGFWRVI